MTSNMDATLKLGQHQLQANQFERFSDLTKSHDQKTIRKLAQDFEAIFVKMVVESMRRAVPKSGLVGDSNAKEIFQSMLDTEYANEITRQRILGLATTLENYLSQQIEKSSQNINFAKGYSAYKKQDLHQEAKQEKIEGSRGQVKQE